MKTLIAALIVALTLLLPWLDHPVPGRGNEPTYSGNGKGERDAGIIQECAFLAAEQDPSLNRDAIFVLCLDENGVWAI